MKRSRLERKERGRARRKRVLVAAVVVAVLAIAAAAALAIVGTGPAVRAVANRGASGSARPLSASADEASEAVESTAELSSLPVEVPNVVGQAADKARVVLQTGGFAVRLSNEPTSAAAVVVSQEPSAGVRAERGSEVLLMLGAAAKAAAPKHFVVCIDPGHQSRSDLKPEPVGPGSAEMKERVKGGATGVSTRIPEYEVALQVSLRLRDRLQKAGVEVVMTRTTNDVNISNSARAEIANRAAADLFVRVHADGSLDPKVAGLSTLYPADNRWTGPIVGESERAARVIHEETVRATGAHDRGLAPRPDITGFNWSKVPVVLVETGFLSNPVEDRLLNSPAYEDKLADGMAAGILRYLRS